MWIACNPDKYPGSVFPSIWPCDVLDRNGKIIPGKIEAFNTETGEVWEQVLDENGNVQIDVYAGCTVTRLSCHDAPLSMIPYTPKSEDSDSCIIVDHDPLPSRRKEK